MFLSRKIITGGSDKFRDELSVAFDGTDDYIAIAGKPVDTADATYVFWYKSTVSGASNRAIFGHGDDKIGEFSIAYDSQNRALLYLHSNLYVYFDDGADNTHVGDGKWHHAALVVDIDDMDGCKLYIDTIEIPRATKVETGTATAYGNMEIGRADDTKEFEGSLSDFAVYDKHLSTSEVKTLYNDRMPYNHKEGVCSSNLQAWWRMGDSAIYPAPVVQDEINTNLGANKVTDGGFPNGDNWTVNTGWAVSSGVATCSSGFASLEQDVSAVAGEIYRVEFHVSSWTEGVLAIAVGGHVLTEASIVNGYHVKYFQATDTTNLKFYSVVGAQFRGSIDNVSVKKINGNPGYLLNGAEIVGDSP